MTTNLEIEKGALKQLLFLYFFSFIRTFPPVSNEPHVNERH